MQDGYCGNIGSIPAFIVMLLFDYFALFEMRHSISLDNIKEYF
jgi:hypothetical protein